MKKMKLCSLILSLLFILNSFPVSVSATSVDDIDIYKIAEEAFPEYADRIRNPVTLDVCSVSMDAQSNDVVICETRNVSDTERITYQEYANGTYTLVFDVLTNVTSSSSGSGYMTRTVDIFVSSSLGIGELVITGFRYTLVQGGYDQINDYGTLYTSTVEASQDIYTRSSESASRPAFAQYYGDFPSLANEHIATRCTLTIEVGGDECIITATPGLTTS